MQIKSASVRHPIFVSSVPKSGTWLLREMISMLTGLEFQEPQARSGVPEYDSADLIDFTDGKFFCWHSTITPSHIIKLKNAESRNIFLIRNIYDVLLAMYRHLSEDVDAGIGRSVLGSSYFDGKTIEEGLSLMINGFTSARLTWNGVRPMIRQMDSFLSLVGSEDSLLITYDELTEQKHETLQRLDQFLQCKASAQQIQLIVDETEINKMSKKFNTNQARHITPVESRRKREEFKEYQHEMLQFAILEAAPTLITKLRDQGLQRVLAF